MDLIRQHCSKEMQQFIAESMNSYLGIDSDFNIFDEEENQRRIEQREAPTLGKLLENKIFPSPLYKYRTKAELKAIIETGTFHFSTIKELCDPYEGRITWIAKGTVDERRNFLKQYEVPDIHGNFQTFYDDISKDEKRFVDFVTIAEEEMFRTAGVFCMTTKPDDILLWAYYGDSHNGFCIEIDPKFDLEFFAPMCGVGYPPQYPIIDILNEPNLKQTFQIKMSSKSPEWIHESEWRTLKNHFHGDRSFNKKVIRSVIFGIKTSKEDKEEIISIIKRTEGYDHVVFKQAVKSDREYKITISEYNV